MNKYIFEKNPDNKRKSQSDRKEERRDKQLQK